jgi:hypothetical protein
MNDADKRKNHRVMALLDVRVLPADRIPADLKLTTVDIATGGARSS